MTDRPEPTDEPETPRPPDSPPAPPTPGSPDEPVSGAAPPGPSVGRGAALGGVAFVATLTLLFGLLSFAGRSPAASGPSGGTASRSAAPSGGPTARATAPVTSSRSAAPSPPGDPVLVGAGDIADCHLDADSATAALVEGMAGAVFTAGDNAYEHGSVADFRDCYGPTWGRFLARTRPAPGNHDHETRDLAGYLWYFGAAAAPNGTSWYSYDLGSWHLVVLDSSCGDVGGCGPDSEQGKWLTADLAASAARCTLAIWHHPRFSSGQHGNARDVAPFWEALYAAGADVVINGHDHDYERFAPQDPAGHEDRAGGLREFVVGTGGAALREFGASVPNSQLRASLAHGVIRLVLHPTSFEWTFISTSGDFSDTGNGPCH